MKVSKEKAAAHRRAIVEAAGRLFREQGFDGVGVAEITKAAGLTHGGFYGHFASKDALAAEACGEVFAESLGRLPDDLAAYLDRYLTERHRDGAGRGCPMAAFAMEIDRQDESVQASFADGVDRYIDALAERLPGDDRRSRATAILAALVGGMALARATSGASPKLSAEILTSVRSELDRMVRPAVKPRRKMAR